MTKNRSVTWTYVKSKNVLSNYGVKNLFTIKDAFVKIIQFNNVTSYSQRLDILIRRLDGTTEYIKRRILSDIDEIEIKNNFPDIKTAMKFN